MPIQVAEPVQAALHRAPLVVLDHAVTAKLFTTKHIIKDIMMKIKAIMLAIGIALLSGCASTCGGASCNCCQQPQIFY